MATAASFFDAIEGDGIFLLGGVTVRGHNLIDGDSFALISGGRITFGRFKTPLATSGVYCKPGETLVVSRRYYERVLDHRVSATLLPLAEGVLFVDEVNRWRDVT